MRLLWIGSYASDEMLAKMPVKSIGQASGVTSQRSLISGIDQCIEGTNVVLDTLNVQGIPLHPAYPEKFYPEETWSRTGKSKDISIEFCNTNRIKREFSQRKAFIKAAREWIKDVPEDEQVVIFLYEPVICRLSAVKEVVRHHKNTVCTLIVPDIPEFVGERGNALWRFLSFLRKQLTDRMLCYVDRYVFYAEKMAEYYHVKPDRYIIIEGSIDLRDSHYLQKKQLNSGQFILLYSGAITKERAIPEFVKAFMEYPDPDVRLWLTGSGNCDEWIRMCAKKDPRIHHFGFLNTREEVLEKEAQATALLHIRDPKAVSSSYCFPSKLFEYLASGKPVISVCIPGVPDEYYSYMIDIPELTNEGVANAIERVKGMTSSERQQFGAKARAFVINEKSSRVQAKKLLDFGLKG